MSALATVTEFKNFINMDTSITTYDTIIEKWLEAATSLIEKWCGRKLLAADYTEYIDGFGEEYIYLKEYPLISLTSLHEDPNYNFGSDRLYDSGDLFTDDDISKIIVKTTSVRGSVFPTGRRNIKAVYRAGYESTGIPGDLTQACVYIMARRWNQSGLGSDRFDIKQKAIKDNAGTITFDSGDIPPTAKTIMMGYKREANY